MGAILDLGRVLFEPTAVFERVREKPRFLLPFVALAVIVVVCGTLQLPYIKAAMTAQFAQTPNLPPGTTERALSFAWIGLIFGPIVYALILVINALLLWVLVSVIGGEAKFTTLLSVTTYASMSYILLTLVGLVVLTMRGTEQIAGMEDLQPALGLDLLAPGAKGLALAFLRGINPFTLYGVFLTATGISVTHKTTKSTAYTAAVVQLLITLLVTGALGAMQGRR
jgi:hypothetical protein